MKDRWTDYLQLGFEVCIYVLVFFFLGYYLDKYLNTKPYIMLIGIFLGIFSVFYVIWKRFLR